VGSNRQRESVLCRDSRLSRRDRVDNHGRRVLNQLRPFGLGPFYSRLVQVKNCFQVSLHHFLQVKNVYIFFCCLRTIISIKLRQTLLGSTRIEANPKVWTHGGVNAIHSSSAMQSFTSNRLDASSDKNYGSCANDISCQHR
jgi:hypothetical protein